MGFFILFLACFSTCFCYLHISQCLFIRLVWLCMLPTSVAAHGPPMSSVFKFRSRTCPSYEPISNDTPLLQVIKTALCGSDTENVSSIQTATFSLEIIQMNARQPGMLILWQWAMEVWWLRIGTLKKKANLFSGHVWVNSSRKDYQNMPVSHSAAN